MKTIKLLFCFSLFSFSFCEGQSWKWGVQSSSGGAEGVTVATDNAGDCCLLGGIHSDTLIFDGYKLIGEGYGFIICYDRKGNVLWGNQPNSLVAGYCECTCISYDATGNLYAGGIFTDTAIFYPDTLISIGLNVTGFVVKYDRNGHVLWAKKTLNTSTNCNVDAITTDRWNNMYTVLSGDSLNSFANLHLPDTGGTTLVKVDSNGKGIWAKQSVDGVPIGPCSLATDKNGDIYEAGTFNSSVTFDTFALIVNIPFRTNLYLVKYDSAGNVKWAKQSTDSSFIISEPLLSMASDQNGNIYITGDYSESRLIIGSDTLPYTEYGEIFYVKFDPNGNTKWLYSQKILDGGRFWWASGIAADTNNHFYLLATEGSILNSPNASTCFGKDTFTLDNVSTCCLIMELDTSGNVSCGTIFTEGSEDDKDGLAANITGQYMYVGGDIQVPGHSLIFGPDTLGGGSEIPFIARWQPCFINTTGINEIPPQKNSTILLYPNPNNGVFTLALSHPELVSGTQTIEVYNILGEQVYNVTLKQFQHDYQMNLSNQPAGIYLYRVTSEDGSLTGEGKIVIER